MKVTVAYASKCVKALQNDIAILYRRQNQNKTYTEIQGVPAVIPEYDFQSTQECIENMENRVARIKHAINVHNTTTCLPGFDDLTIDQALVKLSQLNNRLRVLDEMRTLPIRVLDNGFGAARQQIQYTVANYSPQHANGEYERVYAAIQKLQLAIDKSNNTDIFEVEDT